jgi:hypothetical protein
VFVYPSFEIVGQADIEGTAFVCHYVDVIGFHDGIVALDVFDGQIPPLRHDKVVPSVGMTKSFTICDLRLEWGWKTDDRRRKTDERRWMTEGIYK